MASSFFNRGISPAAFTGRAVPPVQADPVTTGLINKNSLQLAVVSNQIQGLTAQMNSLVGSLQVISNSLATSQAIERQKEQEEQRIQQRLAEQKLQEGKESIIEKKIQVAAAQPAQKLAGEAQFTLNRLTNYLFSVLGGWLLIKGVETIKAFSEGNKERLNEIKVNVLKGLGIATGVFVTANFGLKLLSLTFTKFGGLLLGAAAVGLFKDPITQLITFVTDSAKNFLGIGEKEDDKDDATELPTGAQLKASEAQMSSPASTNTTSSSSAQVSSPPPTNNVEPQETVMGDKPEVKTETGKGDVQQQTTPTVSGSSSVTGTETLMGNKPEKEGDEAIDTTVPAEYGMKKLQVNDGSAPPSTSGEGSKTSVDFGFGSIDLSKPLGSEGNTAPTIDPETLEYIKQEKEVGRTGSIEPLLEPVKKTSMIAQNVGPAPEPAINVVPVMQKSAPPKGQPIASGAINDAPAYATSNGDNIYTLGAMSNFNVVTA